MKKVFHSSAPPLSQKTLSGKEQNIIKKFLKNHWHHVIFGVFLFIHALTSIFTNLYGDDYYYAAFLKNGKDYFISENIFHYLHTNGRAFVHILDELLIGQNFWFWRIFNVICLGTLIVGIAKISARAYSNEYEKSEYQHSLALTCLIFCLTDVAILRQSFYWATGMMNYLFPVTLTVWFYYFFRRDFEKFKGSFSLLIPAFFASITTEQSAAAALLVTLCFIVSSFVIKKKCPKAAYFGAFIVSLAGFCTIYFSPGTSERTGYYPEFYSLNIFGKINKNLYELFNIIFARGGLCAVVLIGLTIYTVICFKYYKGKIRPTLSLILGLEGLIAMGIYIYSLTNTSLLGFWWAKAMIFIPIISTMVYTAVNYFIKGEIDELYFVWCAVSMQAVMLISPEYGPRTLTISLVAIMIPLVRRLLQNESPELYFALSAFVIILLPWYMNTPAKFVFVLVCILTIAAGICRIFGLIDIKVISCCLFMAISLASFSTVSFGYYGNVSTNELNKEQIENYLSNDTPPESIILYYLPNDMYRYTMPYDDKYHAAKLMELCGIDPNITIWYEILN